jgi:CRISPR system Cascade subunit CasE
MYLSRIKIDTRKKSVIKLFSSPEVIHASVEAAFGIEDHTRKLWRLDYLYGKPCILLLSVNKPDLKKFIEQFGFSGTPQETRNYDGLLSSLAKEQVYRFRLTANPVHAVAVKEQDRGKVMPHITAAQQADWLTQRAEKNGFSLLQCMIVERTKKRFAHHGRPVIFSKITYEGILKIEDVVTFKQALINGIGREKAYGCGLLTLAKL